MWGLTKRPTTGESTEIILKVPNDVADQMTVLVRNIMDMARRNDEDIDDDALYPIEDVIGPTTPGDLLQGLRGRRLPSRYILPYSVRRQETGAPSTLHS